MIMKQILRTTLCVGASALSLTAAAATAAEQARVMMLGVFHFANPGRDMVKSGVIDVMTSQNQAYLQALGKRLMAWHPTDVLVECDPADQSAFDAKYVACEKDAALPSSNEVYQIGFRVAKASGLKGITCFDEGKIGWEAEPMFDYIKKNEPKTQARLDAMFASMGERDTREQATLPLPKLLQLSNSAGRDRENKDLYLQTNAVDAGGGFSGADAAASWWHRNFRMYANVQKAAAPGHRVLVIAGSGHTAILKDLLAIDRERQTESIAGYLEP